MGYFQVRYTPRVVVYDRRGFIRLATDPCCCQWDVNCLRNEYHFSNFLAPNFVLMTHSRDFKVERERRKGLHNSVNRFGEILPLWLIFEVFRPIF